MKQYLALFLFCLPLLLAAQDKAGTVRYEEMFHPEKVMSEDRLARMRKFMGEMKPQVMLLYFNTEATLYRSDPEEAQQAIDPNDRAARFRRMFRQKSQVYRDLEDGSMVEYREFMDKPFLITGSSDSVKWKITTDNKVILGYPCMKAEYSDSNGKMEAWFTPQLPVASGPGAVSALPGLILEMSARDGGITVVATEVILEKPDKKVFKEPKKGKKVTREEFREIMRAKREEMRAMRGGRGGGPGGHPGGGPPR